MAEIAATVDPFTPRPQAVPPRRPFLASYVGRSGRASRWLPADASVEAILVTGRGLDAREAGVATGAHNEHVADWLSHDVLLPRCAAIVTTGGMGTVIAALRAGVPLVVVPTGWEPTTARRVAVARVGVRLSPRRCTPERLRAAVEHVLMYPRYRRNARRAGRLLAAAAGAAELIERLEPGTDAAESGRSKRLAT